jgi:ribosomal protein S18 acetylase RimI-like enzyme
MTDEARFTYARLVSGADPSFDAFYALYADSMPARERKSRALIEGMTARPDYRILLLKRNDVVVGYSVLFTPAGASFRLLEYMAINADFRNRGLGGKLFRRTFRDLAAGGGAVCGLVEVDSDREDSPDREIRRRRQEFYRRLGCLRVDRLAYVLPLKAAGPPPEMDLLILPAGRREPIARRQLARWLESIYVEVYDCAPADPRIAAMLTTVADPIVLV